MKKWRVVFVAVALIMGASALAAQAQSCLGLPPSANFNCLCFGSCQGGAFFGPYSCAGGNGASMIVGVNPAVIHGGDGNDIIAALQPVQALCGGKGNDVVVGAALAQFANGDAGNDVVSTAAIGNIARGGRGNDVVNTFGGAGTTSGDQGTDVCVNINGQGFPGFPLGDPQQIFCPSGLPEQPGEQCFEPGDSLNATCENGVDL